MAKPVYIRCPRCELNYILKKDKLCSVCKAELTSKDDYIDELDLELCPVCKTNYIQSDEVMCASCLKERALDNDINGLSDDDNDEWDAYINRDEEEVVSPDEETGDMAVVSSLDEADLLDSDDDLSFSDDMEENEEEDDEEEEDQDFYDDFDSIDDDDFDDEDDEDDEDFDD